MIAAWKSSKYQLVDRKSGYLRAETYGSQEGASISRVLKPESHREAQAISTPKTRLALARIFARLGNIGARISYRCRTRDWCLNRSGRTLKFRAMWARAAMMAAVGLSCLIMAGMVAEFDHHGQWSRVYSFDNYANAKFSSAPWSIRKNISILCPSPHIQKFLVSLQLNCRWQPEHKGAGSDISTWRNYWSADVTRSFSEVRERKIRRQWPIEKLPTNPSFQIDRRRCATVFPENYRLPSAELPVLISRFKGLEFTNKNIRSISNNKSISRIFLGSLSGSVSIFAFDKCKPCKNDLKECCDKESPGKRRYWICPKFLPPPFLAFSIAIVIVAGGLYVQGLGWGRSSRQFYRRWFIFGIGILIMACGWFGLFFGDWWSPLICAVRGGV